MNFDRLRFVAERAEVGEAREALFGVTIPERPGAFREFCATIGRRVVTEFNYRLSGRNEAHIFVGVATAITTERGRTHLVAHRSGAIRRSISPTTRWRSCTFGTWSAADRRTSATSALSLRVSRATGRVDGVSRSLGGRWNISLFHYRNHGSDFGRVLVGFEVPPNEAIDFERFLETLRYTHQREQDSAAYDLFLSAG